jgi:uncharacterized membrane protein (Fun14 family)
MKAPPATRDHINGIQASILGLLALLSRSRSRWPCSASTAGARPWSTRPNAIGTAFLRTDLLPPPLRDEARAALDKYLDARVDESALPLHDERRVQRSTDVAVAATAACGSWRSAPPFRRNTSRAPTLTFVDAVNRLIDGYGKRTSGLNQHVPELVLGLLLVTFLLAGGIMGFAAGAASHRPSSVTYILIGLMVVLVFIILDLDRPRRGIINVDHSSLQDLQTRVKAALKSGPGTRASGRQVRVTASRLGVGSATRRGFDRRLDASGVAAPPSGSSKARAAHGLDAGRA